MALSLYAIALGSNRRHVRHGGPDGVVDAAIAALAPLGTVMRRSAILRTPALGPAGRDFANAAVLLSSPLAPEPLLAALKAIERNFGRRAGRRWGPRVLDLDIILWSGGAFRGRRLIIPHSEMHRRAFVLMPLRDVVPHWRDPASGLSVRQMAARLARPSPR